jgi:hypothetical protein
VVLGDRRETGHREYTGGPEGSTWVAGALRGGVVDGDGGEAARAEGAAGNDA